MWGAVYFGELTAGQNQSSRSRDWQGSARDEGNGGAVFGIEMQIPWSTSSRDSGKTKYDDCLSTRFELELELELDGCHEIRCDTMLSRQVVATSARFEGLWWWIKIRGQKWRRNLKVAEWVGATCPSRWPVQVCTCRQWRQVPTTGAVCSTARLVETRPVGGDLRNWKLRQHAR